MDSATDGAGGSSLREEGEAPLEDSTVLPRGASVGNKAALPSGPVLTMHPITSSREPTHPAREHALPGPRGGGTTGGGMAAPRLPCSSWAQPAPAFGASDGPTPREPRTRGRTFGLFYEQVRDLRANQEAPRRRQALRSPPEGAPRPPFVLLESGTGATSTRRCPVPSQAGAAQSHPESHAHSIPHLKVESYRPVRLSS